MIEILPEERWGELEEIFDKIFDAALPDKGKAHIIASVDNGEIRGFLVAEMLLRVGQIWTDESDTMMPRKLINYLTGNLKNTSVIVIASDARFEKMLKHLDMREMEGKVFRRDF